MANMHSEFYFFLLRLSRVDLCGNLLVRACVRARGFDAMSMRMESVVTWGLGSTTASPGLNFTSTASIHPSSRPSLELKQPQRDLRRQRHIYILSLLLSGSLPTNAQGSRLCLSPLPSSACCLFTCCKYALCRRKKVSAVFIKIVYN